MNVTPDKRKVFLHHERAILDALGQGLQQVGAPFHPSLHQPAGGGGGGVPAQAAPAVQADAQKERNAALCCCPCCSCGSPADLPLAFRMRWG